MAQEKRKNKFEMKYSFANSDLKLITFIKTIQEKLLTDIAYKHYKKSNETKSLGSCR